MPEQHPIEVDCRRVKQWLDSRSDFLLLDCRERDEHALVNLPQALLLPMSELQNRAGELDEYKGRDIVVHCHHGGRSLRVAMWLRQQGHSTACSMSGGIDGWAAQIDPSLPRY